MNAKQLSKSGARGKDLDGYIREQLAVIDDRLQRADRTWGRNVVSCELPVSITLPGLDMRDAQRIVYSAILRSLKSRGFELALQLEPTKTTLHIAWMTDLDSEEVEAMNALLRAHRIDRANLPAFLDRGSAPAPRAATMVRKGAASAPAPLKVATGAQEMRPRGGLAQRQAAPAPGGAPGAMSAAETALLGQGGAT